MLEISAIGNMYMYMLKDCSSLTKLTECQNSNASTQPPESKLFQFQNASLKNIKCLEEYSKKTACPSVEGEQN